MTVTLNMPNMAVNGLSENWLFRDCGDRHWQALCESLDTPSSELRDAAGSRIYASFVAISGRYSAPLSALKENDRLTPSVSLAHFGRSFVHGQITLENRDLELRLEMLTAFVSRAQASRNELRKTTPHASLQYRFPAPDDAPDILTRARTMFRGDAPSHEIDGIRLAFEAGAGLQDVYDPSPYQDYNGASLLYFASYPTIADTIERRLAHRENLLPGRDWALATSTVAREVFYYRNLDLGDRLRVTLRALSFTGSRVATHLSLANAENGLPLADVFAVKQILS